MIDLGAKVVDSVSGYAGTVTARMEELNGTPSLRVTGLHKRGSHGLPNEWFEEARLKPARAAAGRAAGKKATPDGPTRMRGGAAKKATSAGRRSRNQQKENAAA